ncbi:MAG: DUF3021 domain-containing protein [Clostridia bacterium]|nr:DUF3021 domain-containing protein [Clostridia bacterium]
MNKYVKEFLHRGLVFGGFGPIITAIVMLILSHTINDFSLTGNEMFLGVVSTYILAFVHAGSSIFHQIEHWSVMKSLLGQLGTLYAAYAICYLINSWIPFEPVVLAIFTGVFVVGYLVIWGIVYLCVKNTSKKLSEKLV